MEKDWKAVAASLEASHEGSWLTSGRDDLITAFPVLRLPPSKTVVSSLEPHAVITSYNWIKSEHPTICLPFTLPRDAGVSMIDANAAKWPSSPFEPALRAAAITSPRYSFNDVDLLVNRNTLRKFFDMCRGKSPSHSDFRLNLFMERNTLIIERTEKYNVTRAEDAFGYGKNFEDACTDAPKGLEESVSHHRMIECRFGGLKCAIRFEVDACIPAEALGGHEGVATEIAPSPVISENQGIRIIHAGPGSRDDALVELKSRKVRPTTISQNMPQLWFGRLDHLVQGIHENGTFRSVERQTESTNQQTLQRMVTLLEELRAVVDNTKSLSAVAVWTKADGLRVYESTSDRKVLPDDLVERFWGTGKEAA
ncbi:hypothetical protein NLU13_8609 [Sarocladium strictum]|uniref:Uncharacterized protein n=1 Tax=Sarocladium strictum TaxID=5046 RepID=A0AA39GD78_SARSR|nr:hypothetical protein NLU13_8609 [Sarocladium strictum]